MEYDQEKIDDAVLGAFEFDGGRAWKRFDFGVMDRLHANGLISQPVGRAQSV